MSPDITWSGVDQTNRIANRFTGDQFSRSFPQPVLCSTLQAAGNNQWLWYGYITARSITLLSALWKSGKSTLLAHLLRAMGRGELFCGRSVTAGRALIVTEESPALWARRRDDLALGDHVQFLCRPFRVKPTQHEWETFISYLVDLVQERAFDLVALDTIASLWPVMDENAASEVNGALTPLNCLGELTATLVMHHVRKSDGGQATASRGSGALPSFVDTIIELRRHGREPSTKRELKGYGRWDETPADLIIELDPTTKVYQALGGREQDALEQITNTLSDIIPKKRPGFTFEQIEENWPGRFQKVARVRKALELGAGSLWVKDGNGKKNSPFTYWIAPKR